FPTPVVGVAVCAPQFSGAHHLVAERSGFGKLMCDWLMGVYPGLDKLTASVCNITPLLDLWRLCPSAQSNGSYQFAPHIKPLS
ncbi:MAG: hypothetical protein M3511_16020, partial [Deinococcota bacterium]|nr:hypothetical protein [Deinococcota bacterium]